MKVYILHVTQDETGHTDLVFSSRDKARRYIDSFDYPEQWHQRFADGVSIQERTVDEV